jgi:protein transport protein SEC13
VWKGSEGAGWALEATLTGHSDWVRDAAWAQNLGLPLNVIASAGQDGQVCFEGGSGCRLQRPLSSRRLLCSSALAHATPPTRQPHTPTTRAQVIAWTEQADGTWASKLVHNFNVPVWRVSWSVAGNILAVSDANNAVSLWKETLDGVWQQVVQ